MEPSVLQAILDGTDDNSFGPIAQRPNKKLYQSIENAERKRNSINGNYSNNDIVNVAEAMFRKPKMNSRMKT